MNQTKQKLLSVKQAADLLNLAPRSVLYRINTGKLRAEKIGDGATSAWVIRVADVERALRDQRAA